ncbi:phosphoribosylamine--glycine ligase [Candidatus Pelagibacter bacterium]|jgi:phosphoribosylamine--glycine ligase|nr:phosphoribosylamine--glycine ligase [Candidatus Pelagibacter bacterium]
MNVAVIGSGGREHAICESLIKSKKIKKLFCLPGNGGTASIAQNININVSNFREIRNFVKKNSINLVVVGPEKPLAEGITDYLEKYKIKVFGPSKFASQLEGSKIFTKNICKKYKIPTANFVIKRDRRQSLTYIQKVKFPLIIKADNLASGKGVYICKSKSEAIKAINEIFNGKFGSAKQILFEDFLYGEEMSYFIISDGSTFKFFGSAQDHKRVLEGDKGKNTGGMGAYSPSRLFSKNLEKKIIKKIIKPTLKALKDKKEKFKGFLYAGLMINNNEPYLIEYNVRMGDPECQTILPILKSDFLDILIACCNNKLLKKKINWHNKKSICIVLCSKGYPDKFKKNIEINKLDRIKMKKNEFIFHAGTFKKNQSFFSNGGRVLNFVSTSLNLLKSRRQLLKTIKNLNWQNGFFRKDIGYKVIK